MPTPRSEANALAGRIRRVWGNDAVEAGGGSQGFLWRVTSPNTGDRIQLHGTPSDTNWLKNVMRQLKAAGFDRDEELYLEQQEVERQQRIEQDHQQNELALAKAQRRLSALTKAAGPLGAQVPDISWLFTAHEFPETKRLLIVPELARKILDELNTANRPLRPRRVEYWASVMRRGRWAYTHQGIAFNTIPELQDGQHRLAAAALEGYTLDVNVTVGMPVENFMRVDVGAGRTGGDTFATEKKDFPNTLSGAGKLIYGYDRYGSEMRLVARGMKVPNDELSEAVEKYGDELQDAVALARSLTGQRGGPKMSPNALSAGIYLISRRLPKNDARVKEFIRGYAEGTNLSAGDARIALRAYMTGLSEPNRKVPVQDQLGVWIKAWNAWVNGRSYSFLSIRKDELMPSVFIPARVEEDD